jgi:hypothetical protein
MSQINYASVLAEYRRLHEEANKANEDRYKGILDQIGATQDRVGAIYDDAQGLLADLGQTDRRRIDETRQQAMAGSDQDLISRGLGNTTIRQSIQRGISSDAERAQQSVTEQTGRQRAALLQGLAGTEERSGQMLASMMERRSDIGPDMGSMLQLMQQAGQADGLGGNQGRSTINTGLSTNARAGMTATGGGGSGGGMSGASGASASRPVSHAGIAMNPNAQSGGPAIRQATQVAAANLNPNYNWGVNSRVDSQLGDFFGSVEQQQPQRSLADWVGGFNEENRVDDALDDFFAPVEQSQGGGGQPQQQANICDDPNLNWYVRAVNCIN